MDTVDVFFLIVGVIIILGFVGSALFRITRIPNPVILMGVGMLLGPGLGLIDSSQVSNIAGYFGTIALLLILFEGGLDLEFIDVVKQFGFATFLGVVSFVLSIIAVCVIMLQLLDVPLYLSILLGTILAGTSPAVIFPTLSKLSISKELRTLLGLETTVSEVAMVVFVILLLQFLDYSSGQPSITTEFSAISVVLKLFKSLGIAALIAIFAGVLWSRFMGYLKKEPLSYMLTLGFVFALYSVTNYLGGKGALAVLCFGLILGNAEWLVSNSIPFLNRLFDLKNVTEEHFRIDETIRSVNAELSFLIRTFFFVYMGILIDFSAITSQVAVVIGLTLLALLTVRWISVSIFRPMSQTLSASHQSVSLSMMPRGLANAVMAFLAYDYLKQGALDANVPIPYAVEAMLPIIFGVILSSNIMMAGFVFYYEVRHGTGSSKKTSFSPGKLRLADLESLAAGPCCEAPPSTTHFIGGNTSLESIRSETQRLREQQKSIPPSEVSEIKSRQTVI